MSSCLPFGYDQESICSFQVHVDKADVEAREKCESGDVDLCLKRGHVDKADDEARDKSRGFGEVLVKFSCHRP